MLKVNAYIVTTRYLDFFGNDYDITFYDNMVDCFTASVTDRASVLLLEFTHPVYHYQDLFSTIENYDYIPTTLGFYVFDKDTVIYSLSNDGNKLNDVTEFFLKTVGKEFPVVLNSWHDKEEIADITHNTLCIRSDRLRYDDYLIELSRGINQNELSKLIPLYEYDLKEKGYYFFSWVLHKETGLDYIHHTSLKNIYYFIGSLLQKECSDIISGYYGGEVFFDGTRKFYILANFPVSPKLPEHKEIFRELCNDLTTALSAQDAHRYLSGYFRTALHTVDEFRKIKQLQDITFFLRDVKLISNDYINANKRIADLNKVTNSLGLIHHMIIYDTGNKNINNLINDLMLNVLKPNMDYGMFLFCYTSIVATIFDKITGGYHFPPQGLSIPSTNLHESYIEIECNNLCAMINELQSSTKSCIPSTKNKLVNQVLDYIHENYMNDISLISITEQLNISSVYMSQLFKKELGLSPIKYIINYRIDRAKYLLRETDESIYNIAVKVGFWEPKHFSKTFKRITGMTPTQYKRQQ